ncbi:ObirOr5-9E43 [Ooceraea biroi]|uniref:Odorant receptor n=1 Tax=Ooceraea biroi TaxID=2015173 RepID=A0A3L8E0K4_OOCBI|nr:ObirOr5-9E43 [Ooceraea biroi]
MRVDAQTNVNGINAQFLYIHRISLIAIGLWPYHRTMLVQVQSSLFSFSTISLTTFLTTELTVDFVIKVLSTTLFLLLCVIQYNSFWINTHVVKRVLENLLYVCSELNDENEIAIIKEYGHFAKRVAIGFILLAMYGVFVCSFLPILPRIFGIFFLVNKSESHHRNTYIMTEYFVDQEKHFYFILLHLYSALFIAVATLLGTAILMTGYFIHFCGLFNIASYRIEQAINSHEVTNRKYKSEMRKKITNAVDIHRKTIEFIDFFLYNFEGTFILIIMIIIICLSLNLFRIFQALSENSIENFVLHSILMGAIFVYSFVGHYTGQEVTDHYNYIFSTAYNVVWYTAPVCVQKLILFLLQRSSKPYGLKFGGLYITSLESFASISTASMSYFTVMYSIQK